MTALLCGAIQINWFELKSYFLRIKKANVNSLLIAVHFAAVVFSKWPRHYNSNSLVCCVFTVRKGAEAKRDRAPGFIPTRKWQHINQPRRSLCGRRRRKHKQPSKLQVTSHVSLVRLQPRPHNTGNCATTRRASHYSQSAHTQSRSSQRDTHPLFCVSCKLAGKRPTRAARVDTL